VLSAVDDAHERIARQLAVQGIEAEVKPTEANLEDVFVAVTHRPLERAGGSS
jgi:ABC-2 type transport system ATP-binding protein